MKTYKVTITNQQTGKVDGVYENCDANRVMSIIDMIGNDEIIRNNGYPKFNGESYELNSGQYIMIEKEN